MENQQEIYFCLYCTGKCTNKSDFMGSIATALVFPLLAIILLAAKYLFRSKT